MSDIVRGTVAFVQLKEIGELDDKGKKVLGLGYGKRLPAPKDAPLALAEWFVRELMQVCRYSSNEAATKDLKHFKAYVNSITLNDKREPPNDNP